MAVPSCRRCGEPMIQQSRYADWMCSCCDASARCPHVSPVTRFLRRLAGRRT